jgi:hypothetical protein
VDAFEREAPTLASEPSMLIENLGSTTTIAKEVQHACEMLKIVRTSAT